MLARAGALLFSGARQAPALQGAREFAAAAAEKKKKQEIKLPEAPAQLYGISAQIATRVWQAAAENNQLDKVQDELAQVVAAFEQQPELARVAVDPFLPVRSKVNIVNTLFKDSGATDITKRLFGALAEENALAATLKIAEAYDELMLAHKKEVHCTIVTAEPMDKLERAARYKEAQGFADKGFKLILNERIDRKLVGGYILEFEDRLVDMSVAKKLDEFNNLVFKLESDLAA